MCSSCMNPKNSCRSRCATFPACCKNQGSLPVSARPSHVVGFPGRCFRRACSCWSSWSKAIFSDPKLAIFSSFFWVSTIGLFQTSMTDDLGCFFWWRVGLVILPVSHWAVSSFFWFDFQVLSLRRHTNIPKFSWFCCTSFFFAFFLNKFDIREQHPALSETSSSGFQR